LKSISGKDFIKIIEKKGWKLKNINGSHHVYMREGRPFRISVPVHRNQSLKIGLLKHIMNLAEIEEGEL
jgi:predicted RNA binding protein YcfA (HicA-like mRNA interferase family)